MHSRYAIAPTPDVIDENIHLLVFPYGCFSQKGFAWAVTSLTPALPHFSFCVSCFIRQPSWHVRFSTLTQTSPYPTKLQPHVGDVSFVKASFTEKRHPPPQYKFCEVSIHNVTLQQDQALLPSSPDKGRR